MLNRAGVGAIKACRISELGCGTAYVSCRLARRGARVVAIDNSSAQLATARRLELEHGLDFPLIHGNAEKVRYPDASFDFAISEYGACLWADPQRWVPEAARLLRPGGQLVFLTNSFLMTLCMPVVPHNLIRANSLVVWMDWR
jgi:ubiquinone/menaquinone biosynthesis C-methylase UbiE